MRFFIVLALLIAIAIVVFALQNSSMITISFLAFHYNGSLALTLIIVFTLGLLSGILISIPSLLRKGSQLREHKRRVRQLEETMVKGPVSSPTSQERPDKS